MGGFTSRAVDILSQALRKRHASVYPGHGYGMTATIGDKWVRVDCLCGWFAWEPHDG